MRACPVWRGPLRSWQLSKMLACVWLWRGALKSRLRPKMLACMCVLSTGMICAASVYTHNSQGISAKRTPYCQRESYLFISDNNHVDLMIEQALRSSFNDSRRPKLSPEDQASALSAGSDVLRPEVAHNCKPADDSELKGGPQGVQNGSDCRPCVRRLPISGQHFHQLGQVLPNTTSVPLEELEAKFPDMEPGGRWRPSNCWPSQRLAIIIPYRNRLAHLNILLNNLIPFCRRQQADVTFFVVEQEQSSVFNRGALMNAGFLEADKLAQFDCFIFHDVDLIPLNDRNLYRCGENPRHFAVALNKYGYNLYYEGYFGGVVGFTRQQYLDINGNSNLYFGWGGEDDDLLLRSVSQGYFVSRYTLHTARYDMIAHRLDPGNDVNPYREVLLRTATRRQTVEGLSTARYQVIHKDTQHLYTWITVSLNLTNIFQTAPDYILRDIQEAENLQNNNNSQVPTLKWFYVVLLVTCSSCLPQSGQCLREQW